MEIQIAPQPGNFQGVKGYELGQIFIMCTYAYFVSSLTIRIKMALMFHILQNYGEHPWFLSQEFTEMIRTTQFAQCLNEWFSFARGDTWMVQQTCIISALMT